MSSEKPSILVVEDEPKMRRLLELQLADEGFRAQTVADAETAIKLVNSAPFDLIVTDLKLPGMSGIEFLQSVKRANAAVPIIIMTAYGTVESAVEAMKMGASDYVLKPFSLAELVLVIRKELASHQLREENRTLREALGQRYQYDNIVARSEKMQAVLALVERVAPTNSTVLLGGESGVGKDLIARAIHQHSNRSTGPFIKINSTAIPENLLESELFGYKRGAFTGAMNEKIGLLKSADKGTVFLDEIGDMPLALQIKLLRVLQEREVYPLGSNDPVSFDVRVLCATNKDLEVEAKSGRFREELLYRINVITIKLPPLRERKDDIPLLASHFLKKFERSLGRGGMRFSKGAMKLLLSYVWPGNVRELENTIERAAILAETDVIHSHDLPDKLRSNVLPPGVEMDNGNVTLEDLEREHIKRVLGKVEGNKDRAAQMLGIHVSTLYRKMQRYRLDGPETFGAPPQQARIA